MIEMEDPIRLFEESQKAAADGAKLEKKFQRMTRALFTTQAGRDWLRIGLVRSNFMGSVFSGDDRMNAVSAAYRDGIRSVFSDILNSAAAAGPPPGDQADDES